MSLFLSFPLFKLTASSRTDASFFCRSIYLPVSMPLPPFPSVSCSQSVVQYPPLSVSLPDSPSLRLRACSSQSPLSSARLSACLPVCLHLFAPTCQQYVLYQLVSVLYIYLSALSAVAVACVGYVQSVCVCVCSCGSGSRATICTAGGSHPNRSRSMIHLSLY